MLTDRHFPYSSMQEINLDWILTKVKNLMRFLPDDGSVGQILRRTAHGAEWSNEQGGGGAVTSVNGQTGDVVLAIPDSTSDLINDSGFVDAAGAAAAAPVQKVNGQTGTVTINKTSVGLGNVQNVLQYSASNPPPYPVTSVNGQTGAVTLSIPTDTSDLSNNAGFVDAAGAAAAAPVQSVNGQTGAVSVPNPPIYVIETGTSNGWTYNKFNDGHIEARRIMVETRSPYTTVSGFYGFSITGIQTPFTMVGDYTVLCTWSIGGGFSIPAGILTITSTDFGAYALSTQGGSTTARLQMLLIGNI